MRTWGSAPGKVFLLGEYAVLAGLPCVVASVGSRFEWTTGVSAFHPESPAGRLLAWAEKALPAEILQEARAEMGFRDPWKEAGGFGASTAQFALLYRLLSQRAGWEPTWSAAWRLYRELTRKESEGQSPSGADLVAQWRGGVTWFDPAALHAEDLFEQMDFSALMIFSATGQAGRKVATHHHLDSLDATSWLKTAERWRHALESPLRSGTAAIRRGDSVALGSAMNDYAQALQELGLEVPATRADREAISKISGVLGVKGAGALQADTVLVLLDSHQDLVSLRGEVRALAESRGLTLVTESLRREEGLQWAND